MLEYVRRPLFSLKLEDVIKRMWAACIQYTHRRRSDTQAKAKVGTSVWGGKIYSIPCRASCFALVYLEENFELIIFFQIDREKTASAVRNYINSPPKKKADATTFVFASLSILLLWLFCMRTHILKNTSICTQI